MATSGTIGQTTLDVDTIVAHAFRRCGLASGEITAEMGQFARINLYLALVNLSNHGVQMWTISRDVWGTSANNKQILLPYGTVDVLNANRRILTRITITGPTSTAGFASNAFDTDTSTYCDAGINGSIGCTCSTTPVSSVGVMAYGAQALTPTVEYTTDGSTWQTLYTPPADPGSTTISLADGQWAWWEIPQFYTTAVGYRVRETGGASLSLRELYLGNTPQEVNLARLNRDDYSNLPNKAQLGLPLQFWYDYQISHQVMNLWPTPDSSFYQIVTYRHRQIQDVGSLTNTVEVPQRWHKAVVSLTAAACALEAPGIDMNRISYLQQAADKDVYEAEQSERDDSPIMIYPSIGVYTR